MLHSALSLAWHQKGKPFWILLKEKMMGWQWHQLDHMQTHTTHQTDNHASTSSLNFFTGQMLFLMPNHHGQSTCMQQFCIADDIAILLSQFLLLLIEYFIITLLTTLFLLYLSDIAVLLISWTFCLTKCKAAR